MCQQITHHLIIDNDFLLIIEFFPQIFFIWNFLASRTYTYVILQQYFYINSVEFYKKVYHNPYIYPIAWWYQVKDLKQFIYNYFIQIYPFIF